MIDGLGSFLYSASTRDTRGAARALTFFRAALTITGVKRKFHVTLIQHDEGVSVSCPELPGCHSQGANVEEALQNIEDAIRGYLEVYGEPDTRCEIREMEVVTA
jgi:predicted RNase H-like HicB family nuclease